MPQLLLDEHVSPEVAAGLRQRTSITVFCLAQWESGRLLGQPDDLLLETAARQQLTLVTYDRRTIPPLLKMWAEAGWHHGGVIFVDEKNIPPADIGGLIRSLEKLCQATASWEWVDQICFLRR